MIVFVRDAEVVNFVEFMREDSTIEFKVVSSLDMGFKDQPFVIHKYEIATSHNQFEFGRLFERYLISKGKPSAVLTGIEIKKK